MTGRAGLIVIAGLLLGACTGGSSTSSEPPGFPDDFPIYANATLVGSGATYGHPAATWTTHDPDSRVAAFYSSALNRGNWQIVDQMDTTFDFVRPANRAYGGTVDIRSGTISVRLGPGCPC